MTTVSCFLCRARCEAWIEHKTDSLTRVLDAPSTEQNQPRDCSGSGCRRCHQFWPGITTLSITCRVSVWRPRTHDLTDASGSSPTCMCARCVSLCGRNPAPTPAYHYHVAQLRTRLGWLTRVARSLGRDDAKTSCWPRKRCK